MAELFPVKLPLSRGIAAVEISPAMIFLFGPYLNFFISQARQRVKWDRICQTFKQAETPEIHKDY